MKWIIYDSPKDCYTEITEAKHFNNNKHNSSYKRIDTPYDRLLLDAMGMTLQASDEYLKHIEADDGENSSWWKPSSDFLFGKNIL